MKRILSSKRIEGYQGNEHSIVVAEYSNHSGDPFENSEPALRYEIYNWNGHVIFSTRSMLTPDLAVDIIRALGDHFNEGWEFGRNEKSAEIRKALGVTA